jgi:single-stranded-DNA-specific exonuclease
VSSDLSKVWKTAANHEESAHRLAADLAIPAPLASLLLTRGVTDTEGAERFLNPRLGDISDPFRLKGMKEAVDRIADALKANDPIVIYGDYDVDGVTSTALMVTILSRLGAAVTPFLPNRMEDGYGLSEATLQRCIDQYHPRLIITVDCGTGSVEAVKKAAAQGIDVVVTDHHEPSGAVAPAVSIVNPKVSGDVSSQMLAGVGVAFKLCHAILKRGRDEKWPGVESIDLKEHLDYVALGTIADIVPLLSENRILARHGLSLLNRTHSIGLKSLMEVSGVSGVVDSYHVGFVLGPRINAAGRVRDAQSALELLLTDHPARARNLAMQLDAANRDRQAIEGRIVKEASELIDAYFDSHIHYGLVVAQKDWHAGVIGIVASRLSARYRRPVIVVGIDEDGVGRGSCRSIEGFDVLLHLEKCSDLLLKYGGHAMAAGLELSKDAIPAFAERFNQLACTTLKDYDLRAVQPVDAWINLSEINDHFMDSQDRFKPFGHLHPMPVWAVRGVRIEGSPHVVGKNHLKLCISGHGVQREAIAFNMASRPIPDGPLDIAFCLQRNSYMGRDTLQLNVQDFRRSEGAS